MEGVCVRTGELLVNCLINSSSVKARTHLRESCHWENPTEMVR